MRAAQLTEQLDDADTTVVADVELTDAITLPIAFLAVMFVVGWSGMLAIAVLVRACVRACVRVRGVAWRGVCWWELPALHGVHNRSVGGVFTAE